MTQKKPFHQSSLLPTILKTIRFGTVYIEHGNSLGTGFIVTDEGHIITARHVISRNKDKEISALLFDHTLPIEAKLVKVSNHLDIAVLKIDMPECEHNHILRIQEYDKELSTGADIAYAGYSFGPKIHGEPVLSTHRGIISSRVRKTINNTEYIYYHIDGLINEGLSGSPICCPNTGVVAGIITDYFGPQVGLKGTGIGGAIPIKYVQEVIQH